MTYALATAPGLLAFRGVAALDLATDYFTETGIPLLTAEQVARLCGVKRGTVDLWVYRNRLAPAGLTEDGLRLFDAGEAAALTPTRRRPVLAAA